MKPKDKAYYKFALESCQQDYNHLLLDKRRIEAGLRAKIKELREEIDNG